MIGLEIAQGVKTWEKFGDATLKTFAVAERRSFRTRYIAIRPIAAKSNAQTV
jgi:hypothetical protein